MRLEFELVNLQSDNLRQSHLNVIGHIATLIRLRININVCLHDLIYLLLCKDWRIN